jgi:hypothetical protein
MNPRNLFRPLIVWALLLSGGLVGCLCERTARRENDFDFDLTPLDEGEHDDESESVPSDIPAGRTEPDQRD